MKSLITFSWINSDWEKQIALGASRAQTCSQPQMFPLNPLRLLFAHFMHCCRKLRSLAPHPYRIFARVQ